MLNEKLGGLANWVCVKVVHKNTVVVGEELATKYCLVVARNLRVKLSYEKSTSSVYITCKSGKRNNKVGALILLEGDLEAELPKRRIC